MARSPKVIFSAAFLLASWHAQPAPAQPIEDIIRDVQRDVIRDGWGGDDLNVAIPTHPNRRVTMRYLDCNALQIHLAREPSWAPIYDNLGAKPAEIRTVVTSLETLTEHLCGNGLPLDPLEQAIGILEETHRGIDSVAAAKLGVSLKEASDFRHLLLQAHWDRISEGCFASAVEASSLLLQRLPMTPDIALGFEPTSLSQVWGNCNPSGGLGGRPDASRLPYFDLARLRACSDEFASAYTDCTGPASEDSAEEIAEAGLEQLREAESRCEAQGATCETRETRDARGNLRRVEIEGHNEATGESFEGAWNYNEDGEVESFEVTYTIVDAEGDRKTMTIESDPYPTYSERAAAIADGIASFRDGVTHHLNRMNDMFEAFNRLFLPDPVYEGVGEIIKVLKPMRGGGMRRCEAINPASAEPVGFRRPDTVTPPVGPGPIAGVDVLGFCLCQAGRLGKQLANSMGFGCVDDPEWAERMKCLQDPFGPTDIVRPECIRYLREDNEPDTESKLVGLCSWTVQCPENQVALFTGSGIDIGCRCRIPGPIGGRIGNRMCDWVYCGDDPPGQFSPGFGRFEACCETPPPVPGPGEDPERQ